jgi:hypothetical protein
MDLGQWKVAEREADAAVELRLDALDRTVRLAREGTIVVSILDDQPAVRRSAHVV